MYFLHLVNIITKKIIRIDLIGFSFKYFYVFNSFSEVSFCITPFRRLIDKSYKVDFLSS